LRFVIKPFLKHALNGAAIVAQNPDDIKTLCNEGLITDQAVRLIRGSGVDVTQFSPINGAEAHPPIVLMPTRLIREKGVSIFAEAARILKARGVDVRCVIAGALDHNNPHAITEKEINALTADGSLVWAGKMDDMPRALNEASLVAYPSWYGEGIPKVLLEAAACGKAIITTDHTGCREVVEHGVNGYLVPVRDAVALAESIEVLLSNPELRYGMGRKSRMRAEQEFNVTIIVRQTLDFYKKVRQI
jgi:glycosyltransferase involved in cell wall biosynthesis